MVAILGVKVPHMPFHFQNFPDLQTKSVVLGVRIVVTLEGGIMTVKNPKGLVGCWKCSFFLFMYILFR